MIIKAWELSYLDRSPGQKQYIGKGIYHRFDDGLLMNEDAVADRKAGSVSGDSIG